MRLSSEHARAIADTVHAVDPGAKVYLFGSRVDDDRKGGDIDLLVLSETITFSQEIDIKLELYNRVGEQKIDMIVARDQSRAFTRLALEQAVEL